MKVEKKPIIERVSLEISILHSCVFFFIWTIVFTVDRRRQEMEKTMQKLTKKQTKTMAHFERAKREEVAALIQVAFQNFLAKEKLCHERH